MKSVLLARNAPFAAVVVVAAAVSAWAGAAPRGQEQAKDLDQNGVVLKTPSGGFEVSGAVKASQTGLPAYPGAKPMAETDKDSGNLTFSLSRAGKQDVHFMVAKLETADSAEQVREYYQKKIGHRVTKFTDKDKDGGMVFEMRESETSGKLVGIKPRQGMTEIDLVRIEGVKFSGDIDVQ
jgi:hypothetical protein